MGKKKRGLFLTNSIFFGISGALLLARGLTKRGSFFMYMDMGLGHLGFHHTHTLDATCYFCAVALDGSYV